MLFKKTNTAVSEGPFDLVICDRSLKMFFMYKDADCAVSNQKAIHFQKLNLACKTIYLIFLRDEYFQEILLLCAHDDDAVIC